MASSGFIVVFTLHFFVFGLQWSVTDSQYLPGTVAVRWEWFHELKLTWNEASHFCEARGGHLATLNTNLTMHALGQLAWQWSDVNNIWMGLHSAKAGVRPNVWEKDCSLQTSSIQFWDSNEPNSLNTDLCNRLVKARTQGELRWRTWQCNVPYLVLCEHDKGNCTYEEKTNQRMTSDANAILLGVYDVTACWEACLAVRVDGSECVTSELRASRGVCRMWVKARLLMTSELTTVAEAGYTVMIRKCFESTVDTTTNNYGFIDKDTKPARAAGSCSSEYRDVQYQNYIPPGLIFGSFPYDTSLMMSTSMPVTSSSVDVTTGTVPESSSFEETTTVSGDDDSSPSTLETTTSLSGAVTSSFSSSDLAVTTSTEPVTSEATSQSVSSSTLQSQTTTTSTRTQSSPPPYVSTFPPPTSKPPLCFCTCQRNNDPPPSAEVPRQQEEDVIPMNTTSRYRRSKTSVYVGRPFDVGVGVLFVIGSFSPVLAFMCCDCYRLFNYMSKR